MKLTKPLLASIYDLLAGLPPFSSYKLPTDVEFQINKSTMLFGSYDVDPHVITISSVMHTTYQSVLETMGHEMVHLALEKKGAKDHANHDAQFNALAAKVCDQWGWDFTRF